MNRLASFLLCLIIILTGCESKTTAVPNPSSAPISTPSPGPATPPPRTYLLNSNGALGFGLKSFYFSGRCEIKDDTLFQAIYQSLTDAPWTTVAEGAANYWHYLPDNLEKDESKNDCYVSEQIALDQALVPYTRLKRRKISSRLRYRFDSSCLFFDHLLKMLTAQQIGIWSAVLLSIAHHRLH